MSEMPCKTCGSDVYLRTVELKRKMGQAKADTVEARTCTAPSCPTNNPRSRKVGQVV